MQQRILTDLAGALGLAEQAMHNDTDANGYHTVDNRVVKRLAAGAKALLAHYHNEQLAPDDEMIETYVTVSSLATWQGHRHHYGLDPRGELLETPDTRADGGPDWAGGGVCDVFSGDADVQAALRLILRHHTPRDEDDDTPDRDPDWLDLDKVVAELRRRGVRAHHEHTGGNVHNVCVGAPVRDPIEQVDMYPVIADLNGLGTIARPISGLGFDVPVGTDEAGAADMIAHVLQGTSPLTSAGDIVPFPLLDDEAPMAPPAAPVDDIDRAITAMREHIEATRRDLFLREGQRDDRFYRYSMRGALGGPSGDYAAAVHPGFLEAVATLLAYVKHFDPAVEPGLHAYADAVAREFLAAGTDNDTEYFEQRRNI